MDWIAEMDRAKSHATVVTLREQAQAEVKNAEAARLEGDDYLYLRHSREAERLEASATYLLMSLLAAAGRDSGEFRSYCVGHNHEVGRYIQVETDQGWNPEYFWCETPPEGSPLQTM